MLRKDVERRRRQMVEAQELARENPRAYALRLGQLLLLGRMIVLGFSVLPLVMLVLAGASVVVLLMMPAWRPAAAFAVVLFTVGFGLTVPAAAVFLGGRGRESPEGLILARSDAPRMFEFLDELRKKLRSPKIERVYLTAEFGAAISHGNELIVGLQMMKGMTPEEFSCVLAHEIGHAAGAMNKRQRRIVRACETWAMRTNYLAEQGLLFRPLAIVSEAYAELLANTAVAMRRTIEFEADRLSADVLGAEGAAGALVNSIVRESWLQEDFWEGIQSSSKDSPEPPAAVFSRMAQFVAQEPDPNVARGRARWALAQVTRYDESHPSLAERVERLGFAGEAAIALVRPLGKLSAAGELFGEKEKEYTELLDGLWARSNVARWRGDNAEWRARRFDHQTAMQHGASVAADEKNVDAAWKMAVLSEAFEGRRKAYYHYRAYLEGHMEDAKANFAFGRVLVEEGDAQGIPYILKAVEMDPFLAPRGLWIVCRHHYARGAHADAAECEAAYARHQEKLHEAQDERGDLCEDDELEPAALAGYEVDVLRRKLADMDFVEKAWLCRQKVTFFPQHPQYVVAMEFTKEGEGLLMPPMIAGILGAILELDGGTTVIPTHRHHHRMMDRIREVAGAPVFERTKKGKKGKSEGGRRKEEG